VRVLLDTNVVIWLAAEPSVVRAETLDLLSDDSTGLVLSAVVAWEVSIKWGAGKLVLPQHPKEWVTWLAREFGVEPLPVSYAHAVEVAELPEHHRDPFDRLLIAQAQVEGLPIVTADRSFGRYEVDVIPAR
jgi:PIN domain nuclease of toxin-antitoxin system